MTERIKLPDPRCGSICGNVNCQVCLEECVPEGDGRHFKLRYDMTLDRAPAYPDTDDLNPRLQFKIEKAYTKMIADHLVGKDTNVRTFIAKPRQAHRKSISISQASGEIYNVFRTSDLQGSEGGEDPLLQTDEGENSPDEGSGG